MAFIEQHLKKAPSDVSQRGLHGEDGYGRLCNSTSWLLL